MTFDNSKMKMETHHNIDDLFVKEKWHNKFQLLVHVAAIYLSFTVSWNFVISVFTGDPGSWSCVGNSSLFCQKNMNKTFNVNSEHYNARCKLHRSEWIFTKPKYYSFVTEFDLVCNKNVISALLSGSYYIGGIFGALFLGNVADRFGRKPILLICILVVACFGITGSLVNNIWLLFIANVFVGGGSAGCFFGVLVYWEEFVPPYFRPFVGTLSQLALDLSFISIDYTAYYGIYWRRLKLYSSLPCILALFIFAFLIPESPRWLLSSGNIKKTKQILKYVLRSQGYGDDLKLQSNTDSKECQETYSYIDLFKNSKVCILTLRMALLWFTLGVTYYVLLLDSADLGKDGYQSFAISIVVAMVSSILTPFFANAMGRKKFILGSLLISGVLAFSMGCIPSKMHYRYYIDLTLIMIAQFFCVFAFCTTYTWTFEIFPTCVRSQGLSLCIFVERIGIFTAPFVTKVLLRISHVLPFLIIGGLATLTSIINTPLPETKGMPTRENYEDFFQDEMKIVEFDHELGLDNVLADVQREESVQ